MRLISFNDAAPSFLLEYWATATDESMEILEKEEGVIAELEEGVGAIGRAETPEN